MIHKERQGDYKVLNKTNTFFCLSLRCFYNFLLSTMSD